MKKLAFTLSLIFIFVTCCYSSPDPLLFNNGHSGSINDLKYDAQRNLLFSGGEDGNLYIWEPDTGRLVSALPVSREPIQRLAVHPRLNQVALVETKGSQSITVRVWDWEKRDELYMLNLPELPLYLGYSTQGTYLIYTKADWQSLSIHDAQTGRRLALMSEGFGIVSYLTLSVSEKNIMTYQPSGRLTYWELQNGKFIKSLSSAPNLAHMCITSNMRYMAAATGDKLMVIDLLTGETKASTPLPEVLDIQVAQDNKTIICLSKSTAGTGISLWSFTDDKLVQLNQPFIELNTAVRSIALNSEEMFIGDNEGNITAISYLGDKRVISENRILPISGLAVDEHNVFIASAEGILHFELDLTAAERSMAFVLNKASLPENYKLLPNPYKTSVGLTLIDKKRLAIWDKSELAKGLAIYDLEQSKIVLEDKNLTSALIQVTVRGNNLLLLEKNGQLRILNVNNLAKVFSYFVPGMNRAIFVSDANLIGGKARASELSQPLIRINLKTGETVPLTGSSILNYDLAYDPEEDRLYTLSVERTDEDISTNVLMHYGKDYEQKRLIMRFPNEDFSASLVYAPESRKLYTSLGYNLIQSWDTNFFFFSSLEKSQYVARKLEISQDLLLSLNDNHSLTVWNLRNKKLLLHFFLFKELDWVVVFPHNQNRYLSKNSSENPLIVTPPATE